MGKTKVDEHGEYDPDAGSPHPIDPDDVAYEPCNAVLKYTFERYGERRYCSGMAVSNFTKHGVETDYEHPEYCKHHQSRAALMKASADRFKTGAHAKSHGNVFRHIEPHKQIVANDLYRSLMEESSYDFEAETKKLEIDVGDVDFAPDYDTLVMDHGIATQHEKRAKALWFAALDFVVMENIREEQFRIAAEEEHEGRSLVVGESLTYVASDEEVREDTTEHHLNIELDRIRRNYKEHLKFGGVQVDGETDSTVGADREWVAVLESPEPSPESKDASNVEGDTVAEIDVPDE